MLQLEEQVRRRPNGTYGRVDDFGRRSLFSPLLGHVEFVKRRAQDFISLESDSAISDED